MRKKLLLMIILTCCAVALTGCRSFLIPRNRSITIDDAGVDNNGIANITSQTQIGIGTIVDITSKNDYLLVSHTSNTPPLNYNLELYKQSEQKWSPVNFINSDKEQTFALFTPDGNGVFYTEQSTDEANQSNINQLVWASTDRTNTKTLSMPNEDVFPTLCLLDSETILYCNNDKQLISITPTGIRRIYDMGDTYQVKQLAYIPESKQVYFLATNEDQVSYDLYNTTLNPDGVLTPKIVARDLTHFSIHPDGHSMVYIQQNNDVPNVFLYDIKTNVKTKIAIDSYTSAIFTNDGDHLILTKTSDDVTDKRQTIWIMNTYGKEIYQLTAPHILTSHVIQSPLDNQIYYSIDISDEATTMGTIPTDPDADVIYSLTYDISK